MNIGEYERLAADPEVVEKIAFNTFYAMGRARNPRFAALWAQVSEEEKALHGKVGLEAVYALVDDYTTPGCKCKYCTWKGSSDHGRLIMCQQRWDALPSETRSVIAESVAD